MFGGKCTLLKWVKGYFDLTRRTCFGCLNRDVGECQVATQIETPLHCPELREFIMFEEVRPFVTRITKPIRR